MRARTWRRAGIQLVLCAGLVFSACGDDGGNGNADGGVDGSAVDAAADAAPDADPRRYESVELAFQMQMIELEVPGATFAIVEGGEVTHAVGYGRRHPDQPDPVEPTTLFRVASVTKMMTAIALLQQVDEGTVALDDPIGHHLPGFEVTSDATRTGDVLVEDLLTHTSALNDHLTHDATPGYELPTALYDYTYDVYAGQAWFMAPPGRMFNYTNPGFVLAGLLVELTAGTPYGQYMRQEVLVPLGMTRTFFSPNDVLADGDFATGAISVPWYVTELGTNRADPLAYDNPWGWPAGYAYSSVLDLSQLILFFRDGAAVVLADSLQTAMQSAQVNTHWSGDLVHYGYGLMIDQGGFIEDEFYNLPIIHHAGALGGFSSDLYWVPGCDLGFVTLANTDQAYFHDTFVVALQTLCDLPAPTTGPDIDDHPADHPDFVGTYHDPVYWGAMIVTEDGTELHIEIPSLQPSDYHAILRPTGKDNFVLHIFYDYDITFIRDPTGQAEYLRNRIFVGERVPEGAPPPLPPQSLDPVREAAHRYERLSPRRPSLALPRRWQRR